MTYASPNDVLKSYLATAGTALYTLVGTRIYIPRLPAGFTNAVAALEIASTGTGGGSNHFHTDTEADYTVKCFGGTTNHGQARAVYAALLDRLHAIAQTTTSAGILACAFEQGNAQDIFDPDAGWPYTLMNFRILVKPSST